MVKGSIRRKAVMSWAEFASEDYSLPTSPVTAAQFLPVNEDPILYEPLQPPEPDIDDYSEFPSLSGTASTSQQNASIWGNTNPRGGATAPVQRPQQGQSGAGIDDFRFDDPSAGSRPSRTPGQQGPSEDFPPLGGLGDTELAQSRQAGQTQSNGFGEGANYSGSQSQGRNGLLGQSEDHLDGLGGSITAGRVLSPSDITSSAQSASASRSPLEGVPDDQNVYRRANQNLGSRLPNNPGRDSFALPQRGGRPPGSTPSNDQQSRYAQPSGQQADGMAADNPSADSHQMSELDRYGLKGLMAELHAGDSDHMALKIGMDLASLNLDLNRPDAAPLYTDWAGPFADKASGGIVPDFKLPPAYVVHNVPPLATKIGSFSDETLFTIFYSFPRDVNQELAANELYSRDWRWHKKMQQWMMKAKEFGEPVPLPSLKEERGWYYFFDVNNWRRERKEFILNYEHLYHGSVGQGTGGL